MPEVIAVLQHAGKWLCFQHPEKVLRAERAGEVLPMLQEAGASGLFVAGLVSYESAPAFDRALATRPPGGFPLLCLGLFRAPEVLEAIHPAAAGYAVGALEPSVSKAEYVAAIGAIRERIAEGATYQVNYTYRLRGSFSGDAWAFFCALAEGRHARHAAFVDLGDFAVCSASPELFFHVADGQVVSRPMKGTARRGRTLAEDRAQAEALRRSAKDRAENIMVVDMVRNDIGRIAGPGTVEILGLYDIEKYPTVWQMTSTVRGRVGEPSLPGIFQALFPCASITGAPKAKTMEIIRDIETSPRSIYTGAIGFAAPGGEACFNVAIRTALIDRAAGRLEFGVGGGIVWDSAADAEYEETLTKARVLTRPRPEFRLLETMLWEPGQGIFLLDGHIRRIGRSAEYFDVPLDAAGLVRGLDERCSTLEKTPHRIRLLVSRDGLFEVQAFPAPACRAGALRVATAKAPVDSQDVFLFHKTTHRAAYEQAASDFPDCDDVVLWNERGEVTESTAANIVVRTGGRLVTPPVGCGLLAGTCREHLLERGEIEEGIVSLDGLRRADEVFLVNSVRKWQKAVVGNDGEVAT